MTHIKKVEIFGFKSFGFKNTVISFEPGLVSISGPNGSGKTNILDAIIFTLGENKPKVLRVDKLQSLIHGIDENHHGPKMARTSVHFDNSDREIPVDSDVVEITREIDEQGENTYFLNKKKTTRSQILDLLDMINAGLGQLNAIQQGTVNRISEFTSEEKRIIIESLIGLSYFDEKKTESLKQLADADKRFRIGLGKIGEIKEIIDKFNDEGSPSFAIIEKKYDILKERRNTLGKERKSVVKCINEIDKDKRQTFLDAFDKVDKEIRLIFNKMTGGNAWLELQNKGDIFNSGISYLIQYPKGPKIESTSISSGEKTLASIVFVLALQKLTPSPFYLFDTVDAHLNATNSEKLVKILEEKSKENQFIMISLRDSVVQKAKLRYDVFLKNGVSHVVKVV